jgi:hypothetical protein
MAHHNRYRHNHRYNHMRTAYRVDIAAPHALQEKVTSRGSVRISTPCRHLLRLPSRANQKILNYR